jgi:hypothetical protein
MCSRFRQPLLLTACTGIHVMPSSGSIKCEVFGSLWSGGTQLCRFVWWRWRGSMVTVKWGTRCLQCSSMVLPSGQPVYPPIFVGVEALHHATYKVITQSWQSNYISHFTEGLGVFTEVIGVWKTLLFSLSQLGLLWKVATVVIWQVDEAMLFRVSHHYSSLFWCRTSQLSIVGHALWWRIMYINNSWFNMNALRESGWIYKCIDFYTHGFQLFYSSRWMVSCSVFPAHNRVYCAWIHFLWSEWNNDSSVMIS